MQQQQVEAFMSAKGNMFPEEQQQQVRDALLAAPDSKSAMVNAFAFKNPTVTLILAFLGPWDQVYLGNIGMFFLKWLTCNGAFIWWIIGMIKAGAATREYNYKKLMEML